MDFEDIGNRLANLTMYDVKSLYTQAKNYALNVSEMEAKVREATNDDPWGASSTLMQEIAQGTQNFQDFNEIMPTIYRRFMEKEAREWRQIYKALQLLEYLIKHGSERVVDDARSHLATIKILRNFHYIDDKGKDQGINVRNRAKELAELLSDVEKIRAERRKARANRSKYTGGGNGDFVPGSGGGRYGGFGSDSLYASGGRVGGSGGGYGNDSYAGGSGGRSSTQFEEYDAGDHEEARSPTSSTRRAAPSASGSGSRASTTTVPKPAPKKEVNLFDFDDDEPAPAAAAPALAPAAAPARSNANVLDDDFDDFQAAPSAPTPATAPKPTVSLASAPSNGAASKGASNVFDFLGDSAPASAAAAPPRAASMSPSAAVSPTASFGAPLAPQQVQRQSSTASVPSASSKPSAAASTASSGGLGGFDDLWKSSAGGSASASSNAAAGKGKMTMAEMAKNQTSANVWGPAGGAASGAGAGQQQQSQQKKPDLFDLL